MRSLVWAIAGKLIGLKVRMHGNDWNGRGSIKLQADDVMINLKVVGPNTKGFNLCC